MRLARLDLTRYGRFTDQVIDFGARANGPDLHLVYGPNEAGKSTALSAFLDLLFGIETRSPYGFMHPYGTMRIGAALEINGATRELARIKKPQNSLLDGAGRPVDEGLLLGELGGLDRAAYASMFCLDDDTIEKGGESILASRGDLGQLLFSASAGLADLSQTLVGLRAETEAFYRPRAHKTELGDLKTALAALKEQRAAIDTFASAYAQLVEERARAAAAYDAGLAASRETRARIDAIQRQLHALPRLAALRDIRADLAPLDGLPDPPASWFEAAPRLLRDELALATKLSGIDEEIARLSAQLGAIAIDQDALNHAERVGQLEEGRARHATAELDLPERRLEARGLAAEIAGILRRLGREGEADPQSLIPGAAVVGALRALMEQRSGLDAALAAALREVEDSERGMREARRALDEAGGQPASASELGELGAALAALRGADHGQRRKLADRAIARHRETLAERIAALRPWTGSADALAAMDAPPAAEIARWKAAFAEAHKRRDARAAEVERLDVDIRRHVAELAAISGASGLVSDHDAASSRAARDQAWAAHRRALDADTADAFESALRRDDGVTDARIAHSGERGALHAAARSLALAKSEAAASREALKAAEARLAALAAEVAAAVATTTPALPSDTSPERLEEWLSRRERALETRAELRKAEQDRDEAAADGEAARARLRDALSPLGVAIEADAAIEMLQSRAKAIIDGEAKRESLVKALEERKRDLAQRQRNAERAAAADAQWRAEWASACARCWLGASGAAPALSEAREILDRLADLAPLLDRQSTLTYRIARMEEDQSAFGADVDALAGLLGLDGRIGVLDRVRAMKQRVETARRDEAARKKAAADLDEAHKRREAAQTAIAANAERAGAMMELFDVDSLDAVLERLRSVEKRTGLRERQTSAEREMRDALSVATAAEAEAQLADADRAALESELAELSARFEDEDQRTRALFAAHSAAADRLDAVGGDARVAAIEEQRRTILLEIESKAMRHLRLRIGIAAAEQALRAYRDAHRSAMMQRTSDAFRTISRGAYAGVAAQPDKDSEVLIGVSAGGGSKLASEMSKGTRFQLYLALRVAGYHEFVRSRRPVPFIADDIMETFDDFRAEEAFRLFGEMAGVGQVIYLTHHQHLCDIARRVCPGVRIHELGARALQ